MGTTILKAHQTSSDYDKFRSHSKETLLLYQQKLTRATRESHLTLLVRIINNLKRIASSQTP
jgi:type IV secretory pathway VirD2 relaxase